MPRLSSMDPASRIRPRAFLVPTLGTAALLMCAGASWAQSVNPEFWITNGPVYAVAHSGGTVYIGGFFSRVGPATGSGVPLDGSGAVPASFPKVMGIVNAVAPDGSGGWYIGGLFSSVGGLARTNLAHILADMTVSAWSPAPNSQVNAILVSGSIVYVGGWFTTVDGQARNRIAALNATTGAVQAWNPNANAPVNCLAGGGSRVYVGGEFTNIGGQARTYIAALDATTGNAFTGWHSNADANAQVFAIALGGSKLYVGGNFTHIGGQDRNYLAALDVSDGQASPWNPAPNGGVFAVALNGTNLLVGGVFSNIDGAFRPWLAEVDLSMGDLTSWNPAADGAVLSLSVLGSTIYVGGSFANLGGQPRSHLGAVSAASGVATSWNPRADGNVKAIAAGAPYVYVGGEFQSMGGVARNNLAALDAATGAALPWNPSANAVVNCLAVQGNVVYAGGAFTNLGGAVRNRIAAVDASTGVLTSWNPNSDNSVLAIAVSGTTVYAGGTFTIIGGAFRNRLAALTTSGNSAVPGWDPDVNNVVFALAAHGGKVYAGGAFTEIDALTRNRIAAIDSVSGAPTGWDPGANNTVHALAVRDGKVYAGGDFTIVGLQSIDYLGAIDASSGVASVVWVPDPNASVRALAVGPSLLYVGGFFSTIGGQDRRFVAAVELWPAAGEPHPWNPGASSSSVASLAIGDQAIYAGGTFPGMGGLPQANLAAINAPPEVTSVYFPIGGNSGPISVVVQGERFQSGTVAQLLPVAAARSVAGTVTSVAPDGRSMDVTFDLTGADPGLYNVVVTNPDAMSSPLSSSNLFLVQEVAAPQLRVAIVGPEPIRAGYPTAFDLVIENPGNVDAVAVPLWVTGIPAGATVALDFGLTPPPQAGGEPGWGAVPPTFTSANGQYLPLVIPRVPPGTTTRRIVLDVPSSVPQFELGAAVAPGWTGSLLTGCLNGAGVIGNPSCVGTQLAAIETYLASHPEVEAMSGTGIWAKVAWQCEGATSLAQAIAKSEQVLDHLAVSIEQGTAAPGCGDALLARWRQTVVVNVVFSIDPNDKLAPVGAVSSQQSIPYSIRFENLASATAWARQVMIVDALPASLDLNSLSLDAIHLFGTVHLLPLPGSKQCAYDVDLGHDNLLVRITANLDTPSRQLRWTFQTLDKTTLQPPSNPLLGFLPPNQTPPQGEGSVLFTIRPSTSTPNGTVIQNSATISFDGSVLTTPPVANTLDNAPPSSNVLALGNPIGTPSFPVSWSGSGPDLKDYTVYVKEDAGPYQVWRQNTVTTSGTYIPRPGGHNYSFYSVARDMTGNIEPSPGAPDAQTFSTTAVEEGAGRLQLTLLGGQPNPARGVLRVGFTLANKERARLELIDIAGRRVLRREVGELGPGSHVVTLGSMPGLQSGVYFVRLVQAERTLEKRVVLMR